MCDSMQINWKLAPTTKGNINMQMSDKPLKTIQANNNRRTNLSATATSKSKDTDEKYGLRACSIQKRIEVEGRKGLPKKRGPKPRPKPLQMSKYRRKTANLRERIRMGEINVAFEKLREKIPTLIASNKNRCEKLTKISILHVAINYIKALENILNTGEPGVQVFGTSIVCGPLDMDLEEKPVSPKKKGVRKKIQQSQISPSTNLMSNTCSKDSGIEEEINSDDILCPDWTELTSTLEFPSDSMLASTLTVAQKTPLTLKMSFSKSNTHDLAENGDYKQVDVMFGGPGSFTPNSGLVQPIKFDFPELEVPEASDFLGDLTALENSLNDSFHKIGFIHDEESFQLLV